MAIPALLTIVCAQLASPGVLAIGAAIWDGPNSRPRTHVAGRRLLQGTSCPQFANYRFFPGIDHPNDDIRCGLSGAAAAEAECTATPFCLAFNDGCIKRAILGQLIPAKNSSACHYEKKVAVSNPPPSHPPPPLPPPPDAPALADASHLSVAVIIGVTFGGVTAAVLLGASAWFMYRRCSSRTNISSSSDLDPRSHPANIECTVIIGNESMHQPLSQGHTESSSGGRASTTGITLPADDYKVELLKSLHIAWKDITVGKVLGVGGFGTVVRGEWAGNPVAVKMLNVEKLSDNVRNSLRQEALAMCALRHPCIAHMYGVVDEAEHQALVMRYYEMGTVAAAIAMFNFYSRLDLLERLKMARQVATGMCYLHAKQPTPIIHGDLKTSNLLIEKNNNHRGVVITDFGLCGLGAVAESGALTLTISPPEVLLDQQAPRTMAGDVYAFGIVLLEILSGYMVYKGMRPGQIRDAVSRGLRPGLSQVPDNIAPLIKDCWAQEVATRPTFVEVERRLQEAIQALENTKKRAEESTIRVTDVHSTRMQATFDPATATITDVYAWNSTQAGTTRPSRW